MPKRQCPTCPERTVVSSPEQPSRWLSGRLDSAELPPNLLVWRFTEIGGEKRVGSGERPSLFPLSILEQAVSTALWLVEEYVVQGGGDSFVVKAPAA